MTVSRELMVAVIWLAVLGALLWAWFVERRLP